MKPPRASRTSYCATGRGRPPSTSTSRVRVSIGDSAKRLALAYRGGEYACASDPESGYRTDVPSQLVD